MNLDIKADTRQLIEILTTNRDEHHALFLKAVDGYQKVLESSLATMLENLRAGKKVKGYLHLAEPEDHTRDYDNMIEMLEMHQDDTIGIGASDFRRFVMDDWEWKQAWTASNTAYLVQ